MTVVMMCLVVNTFAADKGTMKALSIVVKPIEKPNADSIQFTVELVNNTDAPVEIITSGQKPPFTIKAIDENGVDLNSNEITSLAMRRDMPKSIHLNFAPREKKIYSVTLAEYADEKGDKHAIPSGTYQVTAVLPIVSYGKSQSKVELRESNTVVITVGKRHEVK
jgi:hypothetical protein